MSMKTKTLVIIFVLFAAAITNVMAAPPKHVGNNKIGFGVQFNFDGEDFLVSAEDKYVPKGIALAFSLSQDTHFTVNWYLDENTDAMQFTFDIGLVTMPIISSKPLSLNFTIGAGVFMDMEFTHMDFTENKGKNKKSDMTDIDFSGGLRLPVGFSLMLGQSALEIYIHVAPSFGVIFLPTLDFSKPFFPVALGARFWFG